MNLWFRGGVGCLRLCILLLLELEWQLTEVRGLCTSDYPGCLHARTCFSHQVLDVPGRLFLCTIFKVLPRWSFARSTICSFSLPWLESRLGSRRLLCISYVRGNGTRILLRVLACPWRRMLLEDAAGISFRISSGALKSRRSNTWRLLSSWRRPWFCVAYDLRRLNSAQSRATSLRLRPVLHLFERP